MNYTIEEADIQDERIDSELRDLIKAAFYTENLLPPGYLFSNTNSKASEPGFFLVAKENGKMIGCTCFLANDFLLEDKPYVGYQCCWSATDPDHRGRGVLTNIISKAKEKLRNKGAGFLYAIPNDQSIGVYIQKLGFVETPAVFINIPNIPMVRYFFLKKAMPDKKHACNINEHQVAAHKAIQYPKEVKSFQYNNSFAWGKLVKKRRMGIPFRVFCIGGIQLDKTSDLACLFSEIRQAHSVLFIQLVSCETHSINVLFRHWKRSKHLNGFIFYNLNMPGFTHFNIMTGALDVF